ncbi:MAG: hypothetical protein ACRDTJ_29410 [Pseudonocardiaceae bacterium]
MPSGRPVPGGLFTGAVGVNGPRVGLGVREPVDLFRTGALLLLGLLIGLLLSVG